MTMSTDHNQNRTDVPMPLALLGEVLIAVRKQRGLVGDDQRNEKD